VSGQSATGKRRLGDLAKTVRSKNAGVDRITFDVIFDSAEGYERITDFVTFDPARAIKFTILRRRPSGSPGDSDIFGCQQYAPLLEVEVP
jgi:hypothetical protein